MTSLLYLGHAGFTLRGRTRLMMDPWLSQDGAFLRSWFQYPNNANMVYAARSLTGDDMLYISHHHEDHFDRATLYHVDKNVCIVIPKFKRRGFRRDVDSFGFRNIVELEFGESIIRGGFKATLFTDDQYTNEDSGILVECEDGGRFLNMNDCRAYDRLEPEHVRDIDVLAMQFSGATYYPSCFSYDQAECDRHAAAKNQRKFRTVAGVIERINPKAYIPSAGPAQFLDPALDHFNYGNPTPFPRWSAFMKDCRQEVRAKFVVMGPGDMMADITGPHKVGTMVPQIDEPLLPPPPYGRDGDAFAEFWAAWKQKAEASPVVRTKVPLVVTLAYDDSERSFLVDFWTGLVTEIIELPPERYHYIFENRVMVEFFETGELWENLTLSLRMEVHRSPDVFDEFISDMVRLEVKDIQNYPIAAESQRITRVANGKAYEIDRYCPHNKGDLLGAEIEGDEIICPRHGWRFNLADGGACKTSECSINSKRVPRI